MAAFTPLRTDGSVDMLVDTPWTGVGGGAPGRLAVGAVGRSHVGRTSERRGSPAPQQALAVVAAAGEEVEERKPSADRVFAENVERMDFMGRAVHPEGEEAILTGFVGPLKEAIAELGTGEESYSAKEREAVGHTKAALREEVFTWELLRALLTDTLRTARNDYHSSAVAQDIHRVPQHRWWTVSHKEAVALRLAHDHNLRRAMLALVWLEKVYASECCEGGKLEQYVPQGYRTETAKLLAQGLGGGMCPTTSRRLVSSLDFDAPAREKAYLHPADEETERMLCEVLLQHIRCGDIASARRLCDEKGHAVASALLQESCEALQHVPGMHAPIAPEGLRLPQDVVDRFNLRETPTEGLHTDRFSLFAALLDVARDEMAPGKAPFRAVFGAIVGKADLMAAGIPNPGFRDALWCALRGFVEHAIHESVLPLLEGHEEHSPEDALLVMANSRPSATALADFAAAAKPAGGQPTGAPLDAFLDLQKLLLQLLGSGAKVAAAHLADVFRHLSGPVAAAAPRLAAHAAMQLWRCKLSLLAEPLCEADQAAVGECLDAALANYVKVLCLEHQADAGAPAGAPEDDLLLTIVPYLAARMVHKGVAVAAEFAVALTAGRSEPAADALRGQFVRRLGEVGVDADAVLRHAAQLVAEGPEGAIAAYRGEAAVPPADRMGDMVEGIRVLTLQPGLAPHALALFNHNCRTLCHRLTANARQKREILAALATSAVGEGDKDYLDAMKQVDALDAEGAACLQGLTRLFRRNYPHLTTQTDQHVVGVPPGTLAYAQILAERMEAAHWETYVTTQTAIGEWGRVYAEKPVVPEAMPLDPTNAESVVNASRRQKIMHSYHEWVASERRVRAALVGSALKMVTRCPDASEWLVDPVRAVFPVLHPTAQEEAAAWFTSREGPMRELRRCIIPHVTETLLEMFALRADHLPAAERAEECSRAMDIVDALVQDDVAEDQSLVEAFTEPLQAARMVAYVARINAFEIDASSAAQA